MESSIVATGDSGNVSHSLWHRDQLPTNNEARIKTCTRDPKLRLLFVGIALVLRNVWVWLHFKLAKGKWDDVPQLFLGLLRFREMLLWIEQVVGKLLGADQDKGIKYESYQRLTAIA